MTGTIEQRLQALEDIEAIRKLKARYLSCCDRKDPQGMRACFADGPVAIDYGPIGRFDDADTLVALYAQVACHPHMVELHHGVNPQIEMQGASHARATWGLHYCLINTETQTVTQLAGYYEDGYRRVGNDWKIASTRFVPTSTLALDIGSDAIKRLFAGATPPPPA
jgi:hypothetical protein